MYPGAVPPPRASRSIPLATSSPTTWVWAKPARPSSLCVRRTLTGRTSSSAPHRSSLNRRENIHLVEPHADVQVVTGASFELVTADGCYVTTSSTATGSACPPCMGLFAIFAPQGSLRQERRALQAHPRVARCARQRRQRSRPRLPPHRRPMANCRVTCSTCSVRHPLATSSTRAKRYCVAFTASASTPTARPGVHQLAAVRDSAPAHETRHLDLPEKVRSWVPCPSAGTDPMRSGPSTTCARPGSLRVDAESSPLGGLQRAVSSRRHQGPCHRRLRRRLRRGGHFSCSLPTTAPSTCCANGSPAAASPSPVPTAPRSLARAVRHVPARTDSVEVFIATSTPQVSASPCRGDPRRVQ